MSQQLSEEQKQKKLLLLKEKELLLLKAKLRINKPLPFKRSPMDITKNKFNFEYMRNRPYEFFRMTRMTVPVWLEYFANPLKYNMEPRTGIITLYFHCISIVFSLNLIGNKYRSCKLPVYDRILRFSAYLVVGINTHVLNLHCIFNVIFYRENGLHCVG